MSAASPSRAFAPIAVLGATGSGKSTFLAALQIALLQSDKNWTIWSRDPASRRALIEMSTALTSEGEVPLPTTGIDTFEWILSGKPERTKRSGRFTARSFSEVAIEDSKQLFGTGQARNRTAAAVERTVPFELACQAVAVTWYATAGHDPADLHERRSAAPWYTTKAEPSTADMTAKLRRVIIAARFKPSRPDRLTSAEISTLRLAWEDLAA